ncbi:unnamed protein product, partial [Laminaria digitata]
RGEALIIARHCAFTRATPLLSGWSSKAVRRGLLRKHLRKLRRSRSTVPADLEPPKGLGVRVRVGVRVGSGPTCEQVDRKVLHEFTCKVVLHVGVSLAATSQKQTGSRGDVSGIPVRLLATTLLKFCHIKSIQRSLLSGAFFFPHIQNYRSLPFEYGHDYSDEQSNNSDYYYYY